MSNMADASEALVNATANSAMVAILNGSSFSAPSLQNTTCEELRLADLEQQRQAMLEAARLSAATWSQGSVSISGTSIALDVIMLMLILHGGQIKHVGLLSR